MSRVTVLVAAYNAEKYIRECMDSLEAQTLKDIQIVCIDDASTDSTLSILKGYAAVDSRVVLLEKSVNQGQAMARNAGIGVADGDYITMLDADDQLSPDALEKALSVLELYPDTGSVLFRLVRFDGKGSTPYPMRSQKEIWSGQEAFELTLDWSIHGLYVSRTELFRKWPYDTSCRLFSDDNTTRMHYLYSGTVRMCDGIYYYRQHPESLTNGITALRLDLLEANTSMARQLRKAGQGRRVLALFEKERWINLAGICILWLNHRDIMDDKAAMERFRTVWLDIDRKLLPASLKLKFGYWPCFSFRAYFLQIKFYSVLRRLFGK
ncbi:MAG: glycosyltransferase family 2 protein [Bacteroidaceae bacterium]|nr:glycosyltransferase family 2 protein [Bacteroidaceae bacterium]